jgi:hypothetical protein
VHWGSRPGGGRESLVGYVRTHAGMAHIQRMRMHRATRRRWLCPTTAHPRHGAWTRPTAFRMPQAWRGKFMSAARRATAAGVLTLNKTIEILNHKTENHKTDPI